MKKPFGTLVVALSVSALLSAASAFAAAGYAANAVPVATIEVQSSASSNATSTFVTFASAPGNNPCAGPFVVGGSVDNIKAITNVLTAAFLAGKSVLVYWDATCPGGASAIMRAKIQ